MNNQPQACIHESTEQRVVPACCESACQWGTPPPLSCTAVWQRGALRTLVSVYAASPGMSTNSSPGSASLGRNLCASTESRPVGRHHGSAFPHCVHVQTVETHPLERQCALACLHVWLLEASH
uniref:Uncharacterized protein n=1 Tax=Mus musculus TaxID=10090 RepID=Q8BR79_MOUSE|nr:unnamed protein product [Mus musculus]